MIQLLDVPMWDLDELEGALPDESRLAHVRPALGGLHLARRFRRLSELTTPAHGVRRAEVDRRAVHAFGYRQPQPLQREASATLNEEGLLDAEPRR